MNTLCHDCHAKEGELHRFNCDMERCPFCGGQLITCECWGGGLSEKEFIRILEVKDKSRIPWLQIPNLCSLCGERWPPMFHVPDEEWDKFVIPVLQGEALCRPCYDRVKALFPNGWRDTGRDSGRSKE